MGQSAAQGVRDALAPPEVKGFLKSLSGQDDQTDKSRLKRVKILGRFKDQLEQFERLLSSKGSDRGDAGQEQPRAPF